jgi:hypothetical protein
MLTIVGCAAGRGDSGGNFTDYIEFQHSDDSGAESEELLHHANGNSSSRPLNLPTAEDWTWGRLLKDIWKVRNMIHQTAAGFSYPTSIHKGALQTITPASPAVSTCKDGETVNQCSEGGVLHALQQQQQEVRFRIVSFTKGCAAVTPVLQQQQQGGGCMCSQ